MKILIPQELLDQKYIKRQKHPTLDLWIYNYTHKTQFERYWNEWTLMCRGLILDGEGNVISRPFGKFFNESEPEFVAPVGEAFEVSEKVDGSEGISYFVDGKLHIASRGSFQSEQAMMANLILEEKYPNVDLNSDYTYVFEIIYPQNRIVLDYGDMEDLILLAEIHTESGMEAMNVGSDSDFPTTKKYAYKSIAEMKTFDWEKSEGLCLRFIPSNIRCKIKFPTYVSLHKVVTGLNERGIWEILKGGGNVVDATEGAPDELFKWANSVASNLTKDFKAKEREYIGIFEEVCEAMDAWAIFGNINEDTPDSEIRKEYALHFQNHKHANILFAMLDEKDYAGLIWKLMRPEHVDVSIGMGGKIYETD
jgi:hypothetical protein